MQARLGRPDESMTAMESVTSADSGGSGLPSSRESSAVYRLLVALKPDRAPQTDPSEFPHAVDRLGHDAVGWAIALAEGVGVRTGPVGRRPSSPLGTVSVALDNSAVEFLLTFAGDWTPQALTDDQVDLIRAAVRQSIPHQEIGKGFRQLQRRWVSHLTEQISRHLPEEDQMALAQRTIERCPAFFDVHIDAVTNEYLRQRERRISNEMIDRQETVLALLRGETGPQRISDRLGVPIAGYHVALVLWSDEDHRAGRRAVTDVARRTATALNCRHYLHMPGEGGAVWLWLTRTTRFDDDIRTRLTTVLSPRDSLRLAFGGGRPGEEGFRRAHHEAQEAARIARQSRSHGRVVGYRAVSLLALLTKDPEQARWFVQDELGALASAGVENVELRRTLAVYLVSHSQTQTAQELFLHRNSVAHRLQRAEALIGHPLNVRGDYLSAAVILADALPTAEGMERP